MARTIGRLTALRVERANEPGMYADGAGLYLQVTRPAAKSWIYRYSLRKKAREMGLGSFPTIGLAEARTKAADCRRLCQDGIDPIEARKAALQQSVLEAAKSTTFKDAVASYIRSHSAAWRNRKHAAQWRNTLTTYAEPVIGGVSVQAIDTGLVMKVLDPIWRTKTETATRVRQRIEAVLDWAKAAGLRTGDNPARWRGHLSNLLPTPSRVHKVKHHAALPYDQLSDFIASLREREGIAALALEFTILTAARTGDIIGNDRDDKPPMRWTHVDVKERIWTVPSNKTDLEHRVPLSHAAIAVLERLEAGDKNAPVFPGAHPDAPLSNMSMAAVIERMNDDRSALGLARYVDPKQGNRDITVHGFRSTFRDWAAERTGFASEVVEMALAHAVSDKVEAAYRRGDLFEKRRRLMDEWAKFCNTAKPTARGKIVALHSGR
jgi:integrase